MISFKFCILTYGMKKDYQTWFIFSSCLEVSSSNGHNCIDFFFLSITSRVLVSNIDITKCNL